MLFRVEEFTRKITSVVLRQSERDVRAMHRLCRLLLGPVPWYIRLLRRGGAENDIFAPVYLINCRDTFRSSGKICFPQHLAVLLVVSAEFAFVLRGYKDQAARGHYRSISRHHDACVFEIF